MATLRQSIDPGEFSFTRGGPLFRLECVLGLLPQQDRLSARLMITLFTMTWVPLWLISLPSRLTTGAWDPLLYRSEMHIRLLGSLTAFICGEFVLDARVTALTHQLGRSDTLPKEHVPAWHRALQELTRIRDAWQPEALLLGFVYLASCSAYLGWLPPWALRWLMPIAHESGVHWMHATPVAWWYLLISQPLFLFVFLRWVVRWLLFARLMRQLAQLTPQVRPTHADRAGGLAYLATPLLALQLMAAGSALALASVWIDEIARSKAKPSVFATDMLLFVSVSMLMALLPYAPFVRLLVRAKHRALLAYSALMDEYVEHFDRRWLGNSDRPRELLGHEDFSGLADLGTSFRVADEMRASIPGPDQLKAQLIATVVPFLVLIPTNAKSTGEIVQTLVLKLIGGH